MPSFTVGNAGLTEVICTNTRQAIFPAIHAVDGPAGDQV
jgi:hypothetical protein